MHEPTYKNSIWNNTHEPTYKNSIRNNMHEPTYKNSIWGNTYYGPLYKNSMGECGWTFVQE